MFRLKYQPETNIGIRQTQISLTLTKRILMCKIRVGYYYSIEIHHQVFTRIYLTYFSPVWTFLLVLIAWLHIAQFTCHCEFDESELKYFICLKNFCRIQGISFYISVFLLFQLIESSGLRIEVETTEFRFKIRLKGILR